MDVMTEIRQMQAEAFLKAGFTPDEVAKKFGVVPIKSAALPQAVPVSANPPAATTKNLTLKERLSRAQTAAKQAAKKRQAARRPIIVDGLARGLTYADIGQLIGKIEGRDPAPSANSVKRSMDVLGIKGPGSGRKKGGGSPSDISHVCEMMREHFTAAQIALVLGVTRNTVIGHWFRNRNAG